MTVLVSTGAGAGGAGGVPSSARLDRGFASATARAHTANAVEMRNLIRCIGALRHGRGAHRAAACPWAGPIPAGLVASVSPPSGGFAYLRADRAGSENGGLGASFLVLPRRSRIRKWTLLPRRQPSL